MFAGDRRVWRTAAIVAVPMLALTAFYCLRPRFYYTGTDSVENVQSVVRAGAAPVCAPGLSLPADTAVVRLQVFASTPQRPALALALQTPGRTVRSDLPPAAVKPDSPTNADFAIPTTAAHPATRAASLCLTARGPVGVGGTPLVAPPAQAPPSLGGRALPARLAVWYLPEPGKRSSYAQRAGDIFSRAALFRPAAVGAWVYPVLLFAVLPALALIAVRALAVAVAGRTRRLALTLFLLAAVNACCWALITPVFQGPDEVDHFAYTQSLAERGSSPSPNSSSPLQRWSSAEALALEDTSFLTDHQVGDSRTPWLSQQEQNYARQVRALRPSRADGGGNTTAATHGPFYYLALAPPYLLTSHGSIFSQLTLMRLFSAAIGALVVLFTYLLARELAPQRAWLAALAALLVAFEPMYGFISGIVNNDVGVNATAAALELLLIRLLRRGITVPWACLTGAVLLLLPNVKGTGLSLYPVAGFVFAVALWRHHSRSDLPAWGALVLSALAVGLLAADAVTPALAPAAGGGGGSSVGSNASAVNLALHHLGSYLSYLWQVFLPRLPFMAPHFPPGEYPGFLIFIKRGWGAFGWYDVFFPGWVYTVVLVASLCLLVLAPFAVTREWRWLRSHWAEAIAVVLMPVCVIAGFVAAYYTPGRRPVVAEFGRYVFPAIGPVALLVVGALHGLGRRALLAAGVALLVAVIALSYAGQLVTLTTFYA